MKITLNGEPRDTAAAHAKLGHECAAASVTIVSFVPARHAAPMATGGDQ
jgi:hypothetical protein